MTLLFKIPKKIILEVLEFVALDDVRFFHDRLPENDSLQPFLIQRLYKKVRVCNPCEDSSCYIVSTETDMRRIVMKNIPIQLLVNDRVSWLNEIVAEHRDYFSRIPSLSYVGMGIAFLEFGSVCPMDNLVALDVVGQVPGPLPRLFSKLTHLGLMIDFDKDIIERLPNLKSLSLISCDITHAVLPDTLDLLECVDTEGDLWSIFPPSLKTLMLSVVTIYPKDKHFPKGLVELYIDFAVDYSMLDGEDVKWPSSLKKLHFSCCSHDSLVRFQFPNSLENLKLNYGWDPIRTITLPHQLKDLDLLGNIAFDAANTIFPSTLENLTITCENIDCSTLPNGLKTLKIDTKDYLSLFPPNLENLDYTFLDRRREHQHQQFCFQFPSTLRFLKLIFMYNCLFAMNLNIPELEHMELRNCITPVPPSVKTLIVVSDDVISDDRLQYENLVVPSGVRLLKVSLPLREYPNSITNLEIGDFDRQMAQVFPMNLRYLTLFSKTQNVFSIEDIELPPSLYKLAGLFDKQELEEFNSRARKGV